MKFVLDAPQARYVIQSYTTGQVMINQQRYTQSLVIMPELLISDWPPQYFDQIATNHLTDLARYELELILFGTGERLRFPPRALLFPLEERGIGVEIMNTGAACRTYNLLVAEGRRVAAILLMIR